MHRAVETLYMIARSSNLLSLALLALILCAGCGKDEETQPETAKPSTPGQSTASPRMLPATTQAATKPTEVSCVSSDCHKPTMKKFLHEPFAVQGCTACHYTHESGDIKKLRGGETVAEHCLSCHTDLKTKLADAAHKHPVGRSDCLSCHDAHASDFKNQLKADGQETCLAACHKEVKEKTAAMPVQHAAMTVEQGCGNCHDAHASAQPAILKQRMDKTCLTCHDKPVKATDGHTIPDMRPAVVDAKFRHGPVRAGDCSACHDAHGAKELALLKRPFPRSFYTAYSSEQYALCFDCHDKAQVETEKTATLTGFRNGDVNLHYLHVNRDEKGRSCKSCHNVHGNNQPKHIATEVAFERSNYAMPVGFEISKDGGSCTPGCHKTREYQRSKPTTRGSS